MQRSEDGAQDSAQDGTTAPAGELTIDEAMAIALQAQREGDAAVARALYERVLAVVPDHVGALHLLGVLHHQTRRPREAIRLLRRAVELDPDEPRLHGDLGNVFFELDRPDLARQAYEVAILLDPEDAQARNNLGVALRALRLVDEAEAAYGEAVALAPNFHEAWNNLGNLLSSRGRTADAIACFGKALSAAPRDPHARRFLSTAYSVSGHKDRALTILREWLRDEPNNPTVAHLIAANSGEDVPVRASDAYVRDLFDGFAESFDRKLAQLDYRAPELIAEAVAAAHGAPDATLAVLDAGCGTGLAGGALRPFARTLEGVDLSEGMLRRAGERGVYDALVEGELTRHLAGHAEAFDLIVSADTLCYFGDLAPVCAAARGALRPGGRFVFSVEAGGSSEGGYELQSHGRYRHDPAYVLGAVAAAGLAVEASRTDVLRLERGEPVAGLIVTARR
jgi:predicted TPR repeat methyltransferase